MSTSEGKRVQVREGEYELRKVSTSEGGLPTAWCRARQAVIETVAVAYELTKRTREKLFAGWAQ